MKPIFHLLRLGKPACPEVKLLYCPRSQIAFFDDEKERRFG
jgi:hypothetical protein